MMRSCKSNAFSHWLTHRQNLWSKCLATYHYDWRLSISKNKEFVEESFKIIRNLIEYIEKTFNNNELEKYLKEYNEFIESLKERTDTLHLKFTKDQIFFVDKDIYVDNWK